MRSLYVGHQLTDVTVQCDVLLALQLLEGVHEARDQCPENGTDHLRLGSTAGAAIEVGRISALASAWCIRWMRADRVRSESFKDRGPLILV